VIIIIFENPSIFGKDMDKQLWLIFGQPCISSYHIFILKKGMNN